jgi:hypothetical protein
MKKNVFSVFILIFFISLIKKIFSINDETTESDIEDKETTKFSTSKDMAQCTCDLTDAVCDFRCCCDTVCKDLGKSAEWEEKGQCIDKEIDPIAIYRCGTKKENFNYNKNATKMHIKDHIHNIMCIKYDRSGEKGEFYLDVSDNTESLELKNNWIKKFFPVNNQARRLEEKTSFKYGELVSSTICRSNLNGECVENGESKIHFLKPFESSCVSTKNDLSVGTINNKSPDKTDYYGTGKKTVEITYIVNYSISSDNKYKIDSIDAKILKGESNLRHFYVKWKNTNSNNNNDSPKGYLHGKPVRIALRNNNDDPYYYNSNGFFLPISDSEGNCIKDADNAGNAVIIKPILYKKNLMYFCKYNDKALNNYIIYNYFKDTLKIGKYANSKLKSNEDWIDVNNKDNPSDFTKFYNLKIKLIFATSRKSENYLNYEYIEYAKMNITAEEKESATEGKISLIVKFADVSNLS